MYNKITCKLCPNILWRGSSSKSSVHAVPGAKCIEYATKSEGVRSPSYQIILRCRVVVDLMTCTHIKIDASRSHLKYGEVNRVLGDNG